ncbi:MAG: glycosyltransferase family 4 protein [Elainellaceae cyanobacterium]
MVFKKQRPRVCIALPGINYRPDATLMVSNIEPLLPYLEQDFDITLVFRKTVTPPTFDWRYLTILDESQLSAKERHWTEPYFMPMNIFSAWKFSQLLNIFAQRHTSAFDVVIERQWSLVGAFSNAFERHGVPSLFVLEAEFYNRSKQPNLFKGLMKATLDRILPTLRRHWITSASGVILETDHMKSYLLEQRLPIADKSVCSIPNGIDPTIFFPRDQQTCRDQLGISPQQTILTYVGSLRRFIQEPGPLIKALGTVGSENVELHVIGDGTKRHELEAIAQKYSAPVIFHGRLSQKQAALYIGASDLCVAPYNKSLFQGGVFTSASLKVCEYLACARPVLSIPCDRMQHLLDGGAYGFMVENQTENYANFFKQLPSRAALAVMANQLSEDLEHSVLAEKNIVLTWQDIAGMYKEMIWKALSATKYSAQLETSSNSKNLVEAS